MVELHQPGPDVATPRVSGKHPEEVAPLAGAHADHAKRPGPRTVEGIGDLALHGAKALGQPSRRIVVFTVPVDPVRQPDPARLVIERMNMPNPRAATPATGMNIPVGSGAVDRGFGGAGVPVPPSVVTAARSLMLR